LLNENTTQDNFKEAQMHQEQIQSSSQYNASFKNTFQLSSKNSLAKTRVKLDDSDSEDNEPGELKQSKRPRLQSNSEQQITKKLKKSSDKISVDQQVEKQEVSKSSSLEGYKIIGPDGKPVDLNLVVGRDGKMMQVLQQGIDEKASRNREMNQQLSKRMQDRMDYENENMFPERKHEQVKDKKQTSAPVMFNKKGNNKRSQKAESMDIDNSETIVEEEEVYEVENVYENIPSSKNKNKKKQFDRAKVNEAVEKVLKQQSPVKSDSSSEDSSSSSSDSETDVQKNKNELSDDGSSKRKKEKEE